MHVQGFWGVILGIFFGWIYTGQFRLISFLTRLNRPIFQSCTRHEDQMGRFFESGWVWMGLGLWTPLGSAQPESLGYQKQVLGFLADSGLVGGEADMVVLGSHVTSVTSLQHQM